MIEYILFAVGIFLLIKGAGWLVDGSSSLAQKLGVSPFVVGLTIVAFGTSMPELVVNIIAAFENATEVAFGNIIGSNISNILLVLGITAIIQDIKIKPSTVWKEIPFAILAVIVLFVIANRFMLDGVKMLSMGRVDGILLLLFFSIFIYYVYELAKKNKEYIYDKKIKTEEYSNKVISVMLLGGVIALFLGGKWVVEGAVFIAQSFGLSQFLISATIVALGTSLPELVTSVIAVMKKNVNLAVGNIIGSNIFNIFWILGVTSIISPITIPSFINLDIIILFFVTILLFLLMFVGKKQVLTRREGKWLVFLYVAYIVFLIWRG